MDYRISHNPLKECPVEANYPLANRTVQWLPQHAGGATFDKINMLLLHTTETQGWPSYPSFAPHLTYNPWLHQWRQHMPLTKSATTLADPSWTAVRENRVHVIQVEMVGYSDRNVAARNGHLINDIDEQAYRDLANFAMWLRETAGLKIQSSVRWVRYPDSYGLRASQRLLQGDFENYQGILGHEHASGNEHGDPGDFPIKRLLDLAIPVTPPPPSWVWDGKSFPGSDKFFLGATGDYITFLGKMLIKVGWTGYTTGAGPKFTVTDQAAVAWYQRKQGWSGSDADGFPGPTTWTRLLTEYETKVNPVPVPPPPQPPGPFEKVIELDAPGGGNWQGIAQNKKTGEWLVAHSRSRSDHAGEDVVLYRFDSRGRYKDRMTLPKCTHVYGFGYMDDGTVWLTWNDRAAGNDIVTFKYQANKSISKKQTRQMHVFTDKHVDVSFSPTRASVVLRQPKTVNGYEVYRQHSRSDILGNKNRPHGKEIKIKISSSRVVQGFSCVNEFLYVLIGLSPRSAFRIEKWSFKTGKKVGELKLNPRIGLTSANETGTEPEGMDGDMFAIKAGTGSKRRMAVYKITNF